MSTADPANEFDVQLATSLGNADSAPIRLSGVYRIDIWGTFGGGTYLVQVSPDNGTTWITLPNGSFTAAGVLAPVWMGRGDLIRISGSGGTGNSVSATANEVI